MLQAGPKSMQRGAFVAALLLAGNLANAQMTTQFTYQGRLTDNGSLANAPYDFEFKLFDAAGAGTQHGPTVTVNDLTVVDGLFTAGLDFGPEFIGRALWVEVGVRPGASAGAYTLLSQRRPMLATPYAQGLRPNTLVRSQAAATDALRLAATGNGSDALEAQATGNSSAGVHGVATSINGAVGVLGEATGATGVVHGVSGSTTSQTDLAAGVFGRALASVGGVFGVYGISDSSTTTSAGVRGDSASGYGVMATSTSGEAMHATSSTNTALRAITSTEDAGRSAIAAVANTVSGETYGVFAVNNSTHVGATALYGTAQNGAGVRGLSTTGYGVTGYTNGHTGVEGRADGSLSTGVRGYGTMVGVHGAQLTGSGFSINFLGETGVWGDSDDGIGLVATSATGKAIYASSTTNVAGEFHTSAGTILRGYGPSAADIKFNVDLNGNVSADGSYTSPAADFAELLPAMPGLEPGDVLVIGDDGRLARSTKPHQSSVAGVHSTKPAFMGGDQGVDHREGLVPLAVVGIVPVKVVAEGGSIKAGDMLVSSSVPGHAMRALKSENGTVIGKALEPLREESGIIKMLVVLQ